MYARFCREEMTQWSGVDV